MSRRSMGYFWVDYGSLIVGAIIVGVLLGGCAVGVVRGTRHLDKTACETFSRESNRPVKFVDYNALAWDCLTPSANGKWISTSLLYDEVDR